jgi:two-component system chemotaxis response regulator CheB
MTFTPKELDFIYGVARRLTGSSLSFRPDIIPFNISLRMNETKSKSLLDYIEFALSDPQEKGQLVSAVTIHTTRWFRDSSQIELFFKWVESECLAKHLDQISILSAGSSSGQEAYTIALGMEKLLKRGILRSYHIDGWDIDPLVIGTARKAFYDKREVETNVSESYRSLLSLRQFSEKEFAYVVPDEIKKRVHFKAFDILNGSYDDHPYYNAIFCRNVIIYFDPDAVTKIVENLNSCLLPHGRLCLAAGEHLETTSLGLTHLGHGSYEKNDKTRPDPKSAPKRQDVFNLKSKVPESVLIVDDEEGITDYLALIMENKKVKVTAFNDPLKAADLTPEELRSFNLAYLDFSMPHLDGLTLAKKLRHADPGLPIVMVTAVKSSAIIQSIMNEKVSDIIAKPFHDDDIYSTFRYSALKRLDIADQNVNSFEGVPDVILLGSSTGGPKALEKALVNLPSSCPPIVIVQHIGEDFSKDLLALLLHSSTLESGMNSLDQPLQNGRIYLAQVDAHLKLRKKNGSLYLNYFDGDRVESHRPSVGVLFQSAAEIKGLKILAGLLTGMGRDGADGLYALRKSGAFTFAQNQSSCMIFGMPREAIMMGAASMVGTPEDFNLTIKKLINNQKAA